MNPIASARRIVIVGHSGAGKSTLARQLGERLGLPVTHLDALFWQPGWVESDKEAFDAKVATVVASDRWIIDGGYSRTLPARLARADLVIWLDFRVPQLAWRVFKRWRRWRGETRPDIGDGCPEKIDLEFAHWVLFAARGNRKRTGAVLAEHARHLTILHFRHPRELATTLETLPPHPS